MPEWRAVTVKAVVLDHHALDYGRTEPFFTAAARRSLPLELMPLDNTQVWVGRLAPPRRRASGRTSSVYNSRFRAKEHEHVRTYVATIAVNELVMQLRAVNSSDRLPAPSPNSVPFYNWPPAGAVWSDFLIEIWPDVRDDIPWPPRCQFGPNSFYPLAYRQGGHPPRVG